MELRERIIDEALQLFIKFGVRGVTMDRISEKLGISKRTLYETFRDKGELISEGLDSFFRSKTTEAGEMIRNSLNVIETIYILARRGEEMRQQINPLFFEDVRKYYPDVHALLTREGRYRDQSLTRDLLQKGINDGLFRRDLDVKLVNDFFHQVMSLVMNDDKFPKDRYTHEDIFRNIIMPYLTGISTGEGQEQIRKYFEKGIDKVKK